MVLPIIVLGNETTLAASDQVSAKEFLKLRRVGLGRIQCVGQRQSTLVFNAKVTNQCKSLRSCKGDGIPRTVLVEQWRSALGLSRLLVPCSLDSVPRSKRLEQLTAVVNRSQSSATLLADCEWMLRAYLRQQWSILNSVQRFEIRCTADEFDDSLPVVGEGRLSIPAAAWLLSAMHWRGIRDPGMLFIASEHPATGLVRWLSGFTVQQQFDRASDIQRLFWQDLHGRQQRDAWFAGCMATLVGMIVLMPELMEW